MGGVTRFAWSERRLDWGHFSVVFTWNVGPLRDWQRLSANHSIYGHQLLVPTNPAAGHGIRRVNPSDW